MHATKLYSWQTGTVWMMVVAVTKPQPPIKYVYNSCGEAAPMLMAAARPPLEESGGAEVGTGGEAAVRGPGLLINKPKEFNFGFRSAPIHPSLVFPHGHFYVSNG